MAEQRSTDQPDAERRDEAAKLERTERTKLSATFVNNVAVAVIATGLIAPFFAILYGLSNLSPEQVRLFGLAAPGWVIMGGGLHYIARAILRGFSR